MSYRTILVPMGQRENAQSALEAAFLVARRAAGHVHDLHVLPDLTNRPRALVATRMTAEEQSDFSGDSGLPRSTCCGGRRLS